jgi:hypothetical protein
MLGVLVSYRLCSTCRTSHVHCYRWSAVQPVPEFGTGESSIESAEEFYRFWCAISRVFEFHETQTNACTRYEFKSEREFSHLDEDDKEAVTREHRRQQAKENKSRRAEKKKSEHTAIRRLVGLKLSDNGVSASDLLCVLDEAFKLDARMKNAEEEDRLAKAKAKQRHASPPPVRPAQEQPEAIEEVVQIQITHGC